LMGWVGSIFLDLRWVGSGWVTENGPTDNSDLQFCSKKGTYSSHFTVPATEMEKDHMFPAENKRVHRSR